MAGGGTPILAQTGQTDRALAEASETADHQQTVGDINFVESRSLQLRLLTEQGNHERAPDPEAMLAAARSSGQPQQLAMAVAAAAQLHHANGSHQPARTLLAELDQVEGSRADPIYAVQLPILVRTCLALGQSDLAASLLHGVQPLYPLTDHALTSTRAQLAEANNNHGEAAKLYADAANRWHKFGNQPEHAYARLGQGRCLRTLGDPAAETALTQARDLFSQLGYQPALAETEKLLGSSELAAS